MDPTAAIAGLRRNDDGSLTLCPPCSKKDCCPTLKFDEAGGATITDTVDGVEMKIPFSAEQLTMLGQAIMLNGWSHGGNQVGSGG